jgi:hypothetical protein
MGAAQQDAEDAVVIFAAGADLAAAIVERDRDSLDGTLPRAWSVGSGVRQRERPIPGGGEAGRAGMLPQLVSRLPALPGRPRRRRDAAGLHQRIHEEALTLRRPAVMPRLHGHPREGECLL